MDTCKAESGISALTTLTDAVRSLGIDPCVLANCLVIFACVALMVGHMAYMAKMEELKTKQFKQLKKTK